MSTTTNNYVYTLTFTGMSDLEDCNGVYSTFQKAVDALMFHYNRMKDGIDWRWTKPVLDGKAGWKHPVSNEELWAVYKFNLIGINEAYSITASIALGLIDAV